MNSSQYLDFVIFFVKNDCFHLIKLLLLLVTQEWKMNEFRRWTLFSPLSLVWDDFLRVLDIIDEGEWYYLKRMGDKSTLFYRHTAKKWLKLYGKYAISWWMLTGEHLSIGLFTLCCDFSIRDYHWSDEWNNLLGMLKWIFEWWCFGIMIFGYH